MDDHLKIKTRNGLAYRPEHILRVGKVTEEEAGRLGLPATDLTRQELGREVLGERDKNIEILDDLFKCIIQFAEKKLQATD